MSLNSDYTYSISKYAISSFLITISYINIKKINPANNILFLEVMDLSEPTQNLIFNPSKLSYNVPLKNFQYC